MLMGCGAGRITQWAVNQAEPYAHLSKPNPDGLRVQDRGAGRFLEFVRIDEVGDELAAQGNDAFRALIPDQLPHEFDGPFEDLRLPCLEPRAVDLKRPH